VLGVNSRLDSLNPAFWYSGTIRPEASILITVSRVAAISAARQPWSQDQRCHPSKCEGIWPSGKPALVLSQTFEGIFSFGGMMSSHDSFAASGSSPTRKKKIKWDFRVEFHGAILLLVPLSDGGLRWVERHIGADNGYQPYYPTVVLEPRYIDDVLVGIREQRISGAMSSEQTSFVVFHVPDLKADGTHALKNALTAHVRRIY
jgi:hypothetical protein